MNFYDMAGPVAVGSRLRWLGELVTSEAAAIYETYGTRLNPKWFPVFFMLTKGPSSAAEVAQSIGHSHVSVGKITQEMRAAGLVTAREDRDDRRRTQLTLTAEGRRLAAKLAPQYEDVREAIDALARESRHDLWGALGEWQRLLGAKSLSARVRSARARREAADVRIVPFASEHKRAFERLNREWITTHFTLEEPDLQALRDPEGYILNKGGHILVAVHDDRVVGVCALLKMDDRTFELAKMAVAPKSRGLNIGRRLGEAALARAKASGATSVYLESNTKLEPAIALYRALGFVEVKGRPTPYERCNIQMRVKLK
jgi:ribosomal protein S18 acetylase RimI-like enzyme/predicted transcriptional regulator